MRTWSNEDVQKTLSKFLLIKEDLNAVHDYYKTCDMQGKMELLLLKGKESETLLIAAIANNHPLYETILSDADAEKIAYLQHRMDNGMNALIAAVVTDNHTALEKILSLFTKLPNKKEALSTLLNTPLEGNYACLYFNETDGKIIRHKISSTGKDNGGNFALSLAAHRKNKLIIDALLNAIVDAGIEKETLTYAELLDNTFLEIKLEMEEETARAQLVQEEKSRTAINFSYHSNTFGFINTMNKVIADVASSFEKDRSALSIQLTEKLGATVLLRNEIKEKLDKLHTQKQNQNTRDKINILGSAQIFLTAVGADDISKKYDAFKNMLNTVSLGSRSTTKELIERIHCYAEECGLERPVQAAGSSGFPWRLPVIDLDAYLDMTRSLLPGGSGKKS